MQVKFYPYKRGADKVLAMLKGGGHKKLWVVLTLELQVLAILKEGSTRFHPLKGGDA